VGIFSAVETQAKLFKVATLIRLF